MCQYERLFVATLCEDAPSFVATLCKDGPSFVATLCEDGPSILAQCSDKRRSTVHPTTYVIVQTVHPRTMQRQTTVHPCTYVATNDRSYQNICYSNDRRYVTLRLCCIDCPWTDQVKYQRAIQCQLIIPSKSTDHKIILTQSAMLVFLNMSIGTIGYNSVYQGTQIQPHLGKQVCVMAIVWYSWVAFWFSVTFLYVD